MADKRLTDIRTEEEQKKQESANYYAGMHNDNETMYKDTLNQLDEQKRINDELADKQLANTTQKIEQQKEVARQNKHEEEIKALNDYTAFNNPYGYQSEALESQGMSNSGYAETIKLGSMNIYQNRLAGANKVMQDAITAYDMEINDAILNNDVIKAQNALNKLNQTLVYQEKYYTNKATITQQQIDADLKLTSYYDGLWQTMYENIENEKAEAEAIRQFNETMAEEKRQFDIVNNVSGNSGNGKGGNGGNNVKPTLPVAPTTPEIDNCGNDKKTQGYEDYYFNGTKQPRYVDNKRLERAKIYGKELMLSDLFGKGNTPVSDRKVWYNGEQYCYWNGKEYINCDTEIKRYQAAQQKFNTPTTKTTTTAKKTVSQSSTGGGGKGRGVKEPSAIDKILNWWDSIT